MSKEFELYHGIALCRIVHDKRVKSIKLHSAKSNSAYVVNDCIGIYIKYSTKRMSHWNFTFKPHHLVEMSNIMKYFVKSFFVFVCKDDGVVCLDTAEIKLILDFACDKTQGLSASRKPREKYEVGGPLGNIRYKFGDNEFPEKIFS